MGNATQIDIKQEYLIPFHIRILGLFLLILGTVGTALSLYLLLTAGTYDWLLWLAPLLGILGAFIFYSHYRLQIDLKDRTYTVVTRIPFIKAGKPERFEHITKIYINEVKETTTYTTRAAMRYDSTNKLYKAFMKLNTGEKVHMDTDKIQEDLEARVKKYLEKLGDIYQPEREL
ncbi:hypothetical protein [Fulvivirga sedimenti]|uniref:Uncharacterized protein n=1 Tax=Fulvivirga sedimenti TaxID=2879465 RepID=A0A9X1HXZ8_9BACT|nr:hypothetical protein [Fulvivirga sedimenti]MCA6079103.1 hypothetical protein [Fulvivirga sedimenti]